MTTVKICGAVTVGEVRVLAASGADLVGLWHGIPDGPANLPLGELSTLAAAVRVSPHLRSVLVTFLNDPATVVDVVARVGVDWVQLHAYQSPAMVRAVVLAAPDALTVVKVIHVRADGCVERPLIASYERAGTDVFLVDATDRSGRVGSTGACVPVASVLDLADRMSVPFMVAGGISAGNRPAYDEVVDHPLFAGIDVDTAARDAQGQFDPERISAIVRQWQAPVEALMA